MGRRWFGGNERRAGLRGGAGGHRHLGGSGSPALPVAGASLCAACGALCEAGTMRHDRRVGRRGGAAGGSASGWSARYTTLQAGDEDARRRRSSGKGRSRPWQSADDCTSIGFREQEQTCNHRRFGVRSDSATRRFPGRRRCWLAGRPCFWMSGTRARHARRRWRRLSTRRVR